MNKLLLLTFLFFVCNALYSQQQQKTTLDVKITSVEKMRQLLEYTTVIKYKNEVLEDSILLEKGKYNIVLDTGNVYKIEFKKDSYVTKYIVLNTKDAPNEVKKKSKLKIDIGLFHSKENLKVDFLNTEPIGYARYDFVTEKMQWDKEYLKLMKSKIIQATLFYAKSKRY